MAKWIEQFEFSKNVDDNERGSKWATTERHNKAIDNLFERTPTLRLRQRGVDVSINTIQRGLNEEKWDNVSRPMLPQKHVEKR